MNTRVAIIILITSVFLYGCGDGNPEECYKLVQTTFGPDCEIQNYKDPSNAFQGIKTNCFLVKDEKNKYWTIETDLDGTHINTRTIIENYEELIAKQKTVEPSDSIVLEFCASQEIILRKTVRFRPPSKGERVIISGVQYYVSEVEWNWESKQISSPTVKILLSGE